MIFRERAAETWRIRYGTEPPPAVEGLDRLLAHRSVRRFTDQPVDEATVQWLVAAAQSAATSSNLQLYSIISVQDPERRKAVNALCANQVQVDQAAWFFGFFADHYRIARASAEQGSPATGLDFAENFIVATVDAALAAERMVCAAEALGLGICYIGAMRNEPEQLAEVLDLPEGVFGLFGLCIGWPDPAVDAEIKPRLAQESVWFRERYDREASVADYDARMMELYQKQGLKGDFTWTMRSGHRLTPERMSGRDRLKGILEGLGFWRR